MSSNRFSLRSIALQSAAIIAIAAATGAAHADPMRVDIAPGQSMKDAINSFASQTDQQVLVASDLVDGLTAPAVSGVYEPEAALAELLAGTGLSVTQSGAQTLVIAQPASQPARSNSSASGDPVSVDGTVRGAITDSNLQGARVEIVETGQVTATDNLGRFRFPVVSPGRYTLRISYLGRETIEQAIDLTRGGGYSQTFAMGFPASVGVTTSVEVVGARSARAQSLNQERTAPNSTTVLAADALGQFNGATISEALRRAPGIAFEPDPETSEGANVIVRGLEPDLNQVQINGLRFLDGSGIGRSPDLSGILTESIDSVTINKTLLPSQDSNGAGALIEIETKSPFDRPRRFFSANIEYGENGNDFGDEFLIGGTASGIFGAADDFGASISFAYRETDITQVNYSVGFPNVGDYLPLDPNGNPALLPIFLDPRLPFPFGPGADVLYPTAYGANLSNTVTDNLNVIVGLEKEFGGHTNLRFDATWTDRTSTNFNSRTGVSGFQRWDLTPIDELSGEVRGALVTEDVGRNSSPFAQSFFGEGFPGSVGRSVNFSPSRQSESLGLSLRGDTKLDQWSYQYSIGYTKSEEEDASGFELATAAVGLGQTGRTTAVTTREFLTEEALSNVTSDGRVISIFPALGSTGDTQFILPLFTQEGFDFYNTVDNIELSSLQVFGPRFGESDALTLDGSIRRDFEHSILKYLNVGTNYQETAFDSGPVRGSALGRQLLAAAPGVSLADLGVEFGNGLLTRVGAVTDFNAIDRASFERFSGQVPALFESGLLLQTNEREVDNTQDRSTKETTFAGFVEGQVEFGKLELIGGVRFDHYDIESTFFSAPSVRDENGLRIPEVTDLGEFVTDSVSQTDFLPRVLANYRFNENTLVRAGYYTTVSRPQIQNLTQRSRADLNLQRRELFVLQGNPDLKPATTHNFNFDFELYTGDVGVIKVGGFYKRIENPLETTLTEGGIEALPEEVVLPDISFFNDLPSDIEVEVRKPVNGDDDNEIWGLELTGERQLTFLPGPWSGLGLYANYTYTDSKSTKVFSGTGVPGGSVEFTDVPFTGAPEHSGTVGLTYNKYGVDASLFYSTQARRLTSVSRFFLHNYAESFESLDLQVNYYRNIQGVDTRFFLRGQNLLEGDSDPRLQTSVGGDNGTPIFLTGASYFGGRAFSLGVSTTF